MMKITTFKLLSLFESNFEFYVIPYPTLFGHDKMGFVHGIGNGAEAKSTCPIGSVVGDITHRAIPQITFFHCLIGLERHLFGKCIVSIIFGIKKTDLIAVNFDFMKLLSMAMVISQVLDY